jgi:DNA-binding response OmpR family regulator
VTRLILVVDEDPQFRRILRIVLVERGYGVTEAETGEDALKLIKFKRYDLMLLDIVNHGISDEVCRKVRKDSDMPIIVMSGVEENRTAALAAGANDFLKKPFDWSTMFSCVKSHLGEAV